MGFVLGKKQGLGLCEKVGEFGKNGQKGSKFEFLGTRASIVKF